MLLRIRVSHVTPYHGLCSVPFKSKYELIITSVHISRIRFAPDALVYIWDRCPHLDGIVGQICHPANPKLQFEEPRRESIEWPCGLDHLPHRDVIRAV